MDPNNEIENQYYPETLEGVEHRINMEVEHGASWDDPYVTDLVELKRKMETEAQANLDDDSIITDQELNQYVESYLRRPGAAWSNTKLTGQDVVDSMKRYVQETGVDPQYAVGMLPLMLTQGQLESQFGTNAPRAAKEGWDPYSNIYNIGVQDKQTTMEHRDMGSGLDAWWNLLHDDYLNEGQTPVEQLYSPGGFVNYRGDRYASNPHYEDQIRKQIDFINRKFPMPSGEWGGP